MATQISCLLYSEDMHQRKNMSVGSHLDLLCLLRWEALSCDIDDAQLLGNGAGGAPVVAGDKVASHAGLVQGRHHPPSLRLQGVLDGQHPCQALPHPNHHTGAAIILQGKVMNLQGGPVQNETAE